MLISLLVIPIIGILNILINKNINVKKIGLIFSIINLIISLIIFIFYDFSLNEFQFIQESYKLNNYEIYLGIDGLSIYFVVRPLTKLLNIFILFIIFKSKPVLLRIITELVLCKPTNLLDIEMIRGVEHVSKVLNKIKYKFFYWGKVIYIHAFIIMLLQIYSLTLKILDTKCNHKCVEKQNAYLSSWLLKKVLSLKQWAKDIISGFFLGTGDLLSLVIDIKILTLKLRVCAFIFIQVYLYNLFTLFTNFSKGDGVIVVQSHKCLEGSQETVISKFRAGEVNTLHSIYKRSKTYGYNPYDSIYLNPKNTRVRNYATSPVVPVKLYANADTKKLLIIKENARKSGVYRWVNQVNGKTYIGSSVNLSTRFRQYNNIKYLLQYKMPIYKALLKYGPTNFSLEILEYCESAQCIEREQYYLDLLKPDYNILQTAGSLLGFKHSKESVTKISRALTGEKNPMYGKIGENCPLYGRKLSKETRDKLSIALTGENNPRYGKKKPEGSGSPSINIKVLDMLTGIITIYSSMSEAAKALNCPSSSISGYFSRKRQTPFKKRFLLYKLKQ